MTTPLRHTPTLPSSHKRPKLSVCVPCFPTRGSVCSVLLTCCKDSVCRLWAETLLPDDSLLSSHHNNHATGQQGDPPRPSGPCRKNGSEEGSQGRAPLQVRLIVACFTVMPEVEHSPLVARVPPGPN